MNARYYFEQYLIPGLAKEHGLRFMSVLINKKEAFLAELYKSVCGEYKEKCPFTANDFHLEFYRATEKTVMAIITMPKAGAVAPNCDKIYIYADAEPEKLSVFMKEITVNFGDSSIENGYMLCGRSEQSHLNYGPYPDNEAEAIKLMLGFHNDFKPE